MHINIIKVIGPRSGEGYVQAARRHLHALRCVVSAPYHASYFNHINDEDSSKKLSAQNLAHQGKNFLIRCFIGKLLISKYR